MVPKVWTSLGGEVLVPATHDYPPAESSAASEGLSLTVVWLKGMNCAILRARRGYREDVNSAGDRDRRVGGNTPRCREARMLPDRETLAAVGCRLSSALLCVTRRHHFETLVLQSVVPSEARGPLVGSRLVREARDVFYRTGATCWHPS